MLNDQSLRQCQGGYANVSSASDLFATGFRQSNTRLVYNLDEVRTFKVALNDARMTHTSNLRLVDSDGNRTVITVSK